MRVMKRAVRRLLGHRLSVDDSEAARQEWYQIVEGRHDLWRGVSEPYKHTIRAFLVHFHTQILSHSTTWFNFQNGSIGNFFFAGARTFFRSLESAIFLFSRVARIPEGSLVLPAICTEEIITLGAELEDGTVLRGQNNISHPSEGEGTTVHLVDKQRPQSSLPSPIRRVFYLSREGTGQEHEVHPQVNPRVLHELDRSDVILYGMGSLYTSICPSLCLDGVGECIAHRQVPKILLVNGAHDRETNCSGSHEGPMTASDIVTAICDAMNRRRDRRGQRMFHPPSAYVTALLVPKGGEVVVDMQQLQVLGVNQVAEVDSLVDGSNRRIFNPAALISAVTDVYMRGYIA